MASPLAALRQVSGEPRWLGDALRRQRRMLRTATIAPGISAVRTRFGGALLGEELIATLSDRLAATLRWWMVPASPPPASMGSRRSAPDLAAVMMPPTGATAVDATDATVTHPRGRWMERTSTGGQESPADAQATLARIERRPVAPLAVSASVLSAIAAHGAILDSPRADGSGGRGFVAVAPRLRQRPRSSPLDAALLRYWQAAERMSATNTAISRSVIATPVAPRPAGEAPAIPVSVPARMPAIEHPALRDTRGPGDADTQATSRASPARDRWWSGRIDAIHARLDAPITPHAGGRRADDAMADETLFADALADVLRQQARSYGVDIV